MNNTQCMITVGVGDLKITQAPHVLKTLLGSCIGVVLHDRVKKNRWTFTHNATEKKMVMM